MAKNYWDMVLDEVLNKKSTRHFTSESFSNTETKQIKIKPRRKLKMYSLGEKFKGIHFSRREAECMAHFLRGRTVRSAADKLDLSPRTVEFYLRNMKRKLNCRTKSELIELISDSDFMKNVDFDTK